MPDSILILFSLLILLLGGCQEQDVHAYRIAKEHPETAGAMPALAEMPATMPDQTVPEAQPAGEVAWKVPSTWQTLPASGMRLASFAFSGVDGSKADISVVSLPGMAGGNLANVNRWRGQLGLDPIDDGVMNAQSRKIKSKAGELLVVDFSGTDPKGEITGKARMLGAILTLDDKQWFFKIMGAAPVVAQAKPSFLEFLRSLKRASNS